MKRLICFTYVISNNVSIYQIISNLYYVVLPLNGHINADTRRKGLIAKLGKAPYLSLALFPIYEATWPGRPDRSSNFQKLQDQLGA